MQQHHSVCSFTASDSWVILSEIEQSIKRKIEAVGTPLKDWNIINIYRGVLTGYNEAFIISTEKKNEILENCQTEDERKRTEELIRPILRGRDIKRYGYDWAGLYLIATFPSRHYDIEEYPAVKRHLLSFGIRPILRGRDIKRYGYDWAGLWLINTHNGVKGVMPRIKIEDYPAVKRHLDLYWDKIKKRADQGDTPYNLRNCAYVDDFNKPKMWTILISQKSCGSALALFCVFPIMIMAH